DEGVGNEQQVELAALGDAGNLLHDRELHMRGKGAVVAPAGGMVAGAEHEPPEMHLPLANAHPILVPPFRPAHIIGAILAWRPMPAASMANPKFALLSPSRRRGSAG